jgi:hypothetical protein
MKTVGMGRRSLLSANLISENLDKKWAYALFTAQKRTVVE